MGSKKQLSVMYVDYPGLLVQLLPCEQDVVDDLLMDLIAKARQNYNLLAAFILGDIPRLSSRRHLEDAGFMCHVPRPAVATFNAEVLRNLVERKRGGEPDENYIFVVGQPDVGALLRQVKQTGHSTTLWTLLTPSPTERILCSKWEMITMPARTTSLWPRQVMLQALAVAADHLQWDRDTFSINQLLDVLRTHVSFSKTADMWLLVAIGEGMLSIQDPETIFEAPGARLNRQHPIVEQALSIRTRIVNLISVLTSKRSWIAFRSVERALRSVRALFETQHLRHAWLELLVMEGVLNSEKRTRAGSQWPTTTLQLNLEHPAVVHAQHEQESQLTGLIITIDDFLLRRHYNWIAATSLLKKLTQFTSHVEAHALLDIAQARRIVQIESIPGPTQQNRTVATVRLNWAHPIVRDALACRDRLIVLADAVQSRRRLGVGEHVLVEEFIETGALSEEEAYLWVWLFARESICDVISLSPSGSQQVKFLRLRAGDAVVQRALEQAGLQRYEA